MAWNPTTRIHSFGTLCKSRIPRLWKHLIHFWLPCRVIFSFIYLFSKSFVSTYMAYGLRASAAQWSNGEERQRWPGPGYLEVGKCHYRRCSQRSPVLVHCSGADLEAFWFPWWGTEVWGRGPGQCCELSFLSLNPDPWLVLTSLGFVTQAGKPLEIRPWVVGVWRGRRRP